jgi:hypothetical protein
MNRKEDNNNFSNFDHLFNQMKIFCNKTEGEFELNFIFAVYILTNIFKIGQKLLNRYFLSTKNLL